jgi:putative FmdB family regulatory protein
MPVYEYRCRSCEHEFEQLVLPGRAVAPCPNCRSADLERLLSAFAVSSEQISQRNVQTARKRAASARDRVDKQMADRDYVRNHYADEGVRIPPIDDKSKKK